MLCGRPYVVLIRPALVTALVRTSADEPGRACVQSLERRPMTTERKVRAGARGGGGRPVCSGWQWRLVCVIMSQSGLFGSPIPRSLTDERECVYAVLTNI